MASRRAPCWVSCFRKRSCRGSRSDRKRLLEQSREWLAAIAFPYIVGTIVDGIQTRALLGELLPQALVQGEQVRSETPARTIQGVACGNCIPLHRGDNSRWHPDARPVG